jgi:glucose-6-phosphate 1-epimerase
VSGILTADLKSLEARWGRAPGVRFDERFGGTVAVLEAAGSTAVVAVQGAQVLSWRSAGQTDDVLWLSPVAKLGTSKAVRGGVPICWPWFGPHRSDPKRPAHGFVRTATWRVLGSAASASRARLVLAFDTATVDPAIWPHTARAEIEITVGETLTIALSTDNLGPEPFQLTEALHSYLAVGDVGQVVVTDLAGRTYIDQIDGNARRIQRGAIQFTGEVDRIYQGSPDDVVITDRSLGREIRVSKSGSSSTVVWNPGPEKAQRLGDMGEDGYRRMLCIETANAGDDAVTLVSRARHRIQTEIKVRSLEPQIP